MNKAKKLLSLFLALLLAFFLFVPSFAAEKAKKTKFVVLGDSIAQGYGLADLKEDSYGALISKANGYDYVNHAIGGHTSYNLNIRLYEPEVVEDIKTADIIAISIGGNNFLLGGMMDMLKDVFLKGDYSKMDKVGAEFRENFLLAVERIKEINPNATLMVQTLYNPRTDLLERPYQYAVNLINKAFTEILNTHPNAYVIVDVASVFKGHSEYIQKDKIHPNEAGHYIIAQEYVKVLYNMNLGSAWRLPTSMPVIKDDGNNITFIAAINRLMVFFNNVVDTIKSFFRGIGNIS